MSTLAKPTITSSGTGVDILKRNSLVALTAIDEALDALRHMRPQVRDYPAGVVAFEKASAQHTARMVSLTAVRAEISELSVALFIAANGG